LQTALQELLLGETPVVVFVHPGKKKIITFKGAIPRNFKTLLFLFIDLLAARPHRFNPFVK